MAGMPASFFQLFSRSDDLQFVTFDDLYSHCLSVGAQKGPVIGA